MTCTTHHHACDCREEQFSRMERENRELHARLEGAALTIVGLQQDAGRWIWFENASISEREHIAQLSDIVGVNAYVDAHRKEDA